MKVSVVLGTYNRLPFLKHCISTLRAELSSCDFESEIIVIDGGSSDGTIKWLTAQKDVVSIIQHNRGKWKGKEIKRRSWGYFMNLGFKSAQGKYVCMISDDCLVVPGALKNGFDFFEKKLSEGRQVGAVPFYWRNWPIQKEYMICYAIGDKLHLNHGLFLNEALKAVNYIDEDTFHFYYADSDLSLKIWDAGYECLESPTSFIEHYADANTEVRRSNNQKEKEDLQNYKEKWNKLMTRGPDYIGHWKYKEFIDEDKTGELLRNQFYLDRFKKAYRKVFRFFSFIS